jgi:predicted DNA repair protein MutK
MVVIKRLLLVDGEDSFLVKLLEVGMNRSRSKLAETTQAIKQFLMYVVPLNFSSLSFVHSL